ncbi:MAG: hypothetical protein DME64_17060 [Verrucomicrobia bacterium]|jgi:hypothetical protein|nr:MAG: hypothetical protein DME64_17060 [Verrucomicrobiota bacterium]
MVRRASDGTRRIPFAIGDELSAIHCGDVSQSSAEILLHSNYEETDMKNWRTKLISILRTRLTLENWRAKLISLLLATMLWYLIKKNLTTTPSPSESQSPAPVTETR